MDLQVLLTSMRQRFESLATPVREVVRVVTEVDGLATWLSI